MSRRYRHNGRGIGSIILTIVSSIIVLIYKLIVWLAKFIICFFQLLFKFGYYAWIFWGYKKSDYYSITHKSILHTIKDKGSMGEYLIYRHLRKLNKEQKWLFNVYLPRKNNSTTEVDVILLHPSGIWIFESKNYNGWIFGNESDKMWTQCLKSFSGAETHKSHFFNPIIQNMFHMSCLIRLLPELKEKNLFPTIVFGNNCTLRQIEWENNDIYITKLSNLKSLVINKTESVHCLSVEEINSIYKKLFPYTQVSDEVKEKHINDINRRINDLNS